MTVMRFKRSTIAGAAPAPDQLVLGELALNLADGVLFVKRTDGTVVTIGSPPGTAPVEVSGTCRRDPGPGTVLFQRPFVRAAAFPTDLIGSLAILPEPINRSLTLRIQRNDTAAGTLTFAPGTTRATFLSQPIALAPGDVLRITAASVADAVRADGVAFTLLGTC